MRNWHKKFLFSKIKKHILFKHHLNLQPFQREWTKQHEQDCRKDHIFETLYIPRLRFSTIVNGIALLHA